MKDNQGEAKPRRANLLFFHCLQFESRVHKSSISQRYHSLFVFFQLAEKKDALGNQAASFAGDPVFRFCC